MMIIRLVLMSMGGMMTMVMLLTLIPNNEH